MDMDADGEVVWVEGDNEGECEDEGKGEPDVDGGIEEAVDAEEREGAESEVRKKGVKLEPAHLQLYRRTRSLTNVV